MPHHPVPRVCGVFHSSVLLSSYDGDQEDVFREGIFPDLVHNGALGKVF